MYERTTHVLLVEDDEVDVLTVQRAFEKSKISNPLYVARNGIEALNILRGVSGDLSLENNCRCVVLLDLNMPKMNGLEFLEALRADPNLKSTVVTVLTTSEHNYDRMKAYEFNVAGYFVKPEIFSEFTDLVASLNRYWSLCEIA